MSGSKRKSSYRKGVVKSYDEQSDQELGEGDVVAQIISNRGANMFDVQIPDFVDLRVALLPNKYKNLIWIKRNDYVVINSVSSSDSAGDFYEIKQILNKDNIKYIKSINKWPSCFADNSKSHIADNVATSSPQRTVELDDLMPGYSAPVGYYEADEPDDSLDQNKGPEAQSSDYVS